MLVVKTVFSNRKDSLRRKHLLALLCAEQLVLQTVAVTPAIKPRQNPLGQIMNIAVDSPGRICERQIVPLHNFQLSIGKSMSFSQIGAVFSQLETGNTFGHAQFIKNIFLYKFLPAHPADTMNHLTSNYIQQVIVSKLTPESGYRFQITKIVYQLVQSKIVSIGKNHQIASTQPQSATMGYQIAKGKSLCNIRTIHLKFGNIFYHFVIPMNFSPVHQHSKACGRKSFAVGGNGENRMGIHFFHGFQ